MGVGWMGVIEASQSSDIQSYCELSINFHFVHSLRNGFEIENCITGFPLDLSASWNLYPAQAGGS